MPKILKCSFITLALTLQTYIIAFADLWGNANNMISDAKSGLITFANVAVFVGVAIGAITMKLSGGKPDKLELGKKTIKNCLIAWVILNGLSLILDWLSKYLS